MKIKLFFVALLLIVAFGVSSVVFAQTMTEAQRQTLIAQLQAQIATLTQQISAIMAQRQQQGATVAAACYTFENNIGFAQSGSVEVINLHAVLQKEGISYAPDDASTYSTGTVEAVKKFQVKYKIAAPTAGYVGTTTREKLNKIFACKCTPSWQIGPWTSCINSLQTRTVKDANNCGITTNQPVESQSCTIKPIDISLDGSDGPVDIILSLGNGAAVTSSGISLTKTINLKWAGIDVSSCTASDSLTQSIFSGFQPSTGSLSVNMAGVIQASSSTNKISDTFKISCISTITGKTVSDSITVDLLYSVNSSCTPYWQCSTWSTCANDKKTRTCTDTNGCGSLANKPDVSSTCSVAGCIPSWQASIWSTCAKGTQTRTVTDANNCGTTTGKLATSQTCCAATCLTQTDGIYSISCSGTPTKCSTGKICENTYTTSTEYINGAVQTTQKVSGSKCITPVCNPVWTTGEWSSCENGKKTRTVTDTNNCGVTTGKPAISETCCSATCLTQPDGVYTVSCSGTPTKCSTGKTCQLTHTYSTIYVNGIAQTTEKLTGAQCITPVCNASWTVGDWGSCVGGKKIRTVVDANNCGTTTGKPDTSETCCSATCLDQTDGVFTVSCAGTVAKCATGKACELTYSTSYVYVNGVAQTIETLTGQGVNNKLDKIIQKMYN